MDFKFINLIIKILSKFLFLNNNNYNKKSFKINNIFNNHN